MIFSLRAPSIPKPGLFALVGLGACVAVLLLPTPGNAATLGELTQKPGLLGCISLDGSGGECGVGAALDSPDGVAVSPDGRSLYATSAGSNAIAIFDRDPQTGALTQKVGLAGCMSESGSGGLCQDGKALGWPYSVVVSPDGDSVYVASRGADAIAVFSRDGQTGALTQDPGKAGCLANVGGLTCIDGRHLQDPQSMVATNTRVYIASYDSGTVTALTRNADGSLAEANFGPDPSDSACFTVSTGPATQCNQGGHGFDGPYGLALGPAHSLYVLGWDNQAVASLHRDPQSGALSQDQGLDGCISRDGLGGCLDGRAIQTTGNEAIAVSSDGASVYYASYHDSAVAVFDRAADGVLTQRSDSNGCISADGTDGDNGPCKVGVALDAPTSVTVSSDDSSVYVASAAPKSPIAVFDRLADGSLTQKSGLAGCISSDGSGGSCADGRGLTGVASVAISPDDRSVYAAASGGLGVGAIASFDRATDDDTDGLFGVDDACPFAAGLSQTGGCPDGDQDLVADKDDNCPTQPGPPENAGCPVNVGPPGGPGPDKTPPNTTITKAPRKKSKKTKAKIAFVSTEPNSTFTCKLDKRPAKACSSPYRPKRLKAGKHRFSVYASDAAGNVDQTPAVVRWRVRRQ